MKRVALQVVDLAFGDSGKGTLVDYLVRRDAAGLVVRFNGGPQAGHNVVLPDGRHHTFSQFGSGSFVPGVKTLLSRHMLIEPYAMMREAAHLESVGVPEILERTFIDECCLVITPMHQIINRLRERARQADAHGTCGMGVGECVADSLAHPDKCLRAGDLRDRELTRRKLHELLEEKRQLANAWRSIATPAELRTLDDPSWIEVALEACGEICREGSIIMASESSRMLRESATSVFEGAQGVLLDQHFGFHPHTTWSTTTFQNADELLDDAHSEARRERIGVCRSYMTRHGKGPFPTEQATIRPLPGEPHNRDDGLQGRFRRGTLDLALLRYAIAACGRVDVLAVTHLDRLSELTGQVADGYVIEKAPLDELPLPSASPDFEQGCIATDLQRAQPRWIEFPMDSEDRFVHALANAVKIGVGLCSRGPTFHDKETPLPSRAFLSPAM